MIVQRTSKEPMMKRLALVLSVLALAGTAPAADLYTVDKSHSEVSFQVKHLMSQVRGRFTDFDGRVSSDPAKPEASSVEFTIRTASIDTSEPKRDAHLKSADFFDAAANPTITFKSQIVKKTGENTFAVTGPFTMHGITKQVTLPVVFGGFGKDPWGGERAGFEIATSLNRKDYGVVWNKTLDGGSLLLGDEVRIAINLEIVKQEPAAGASK
jgi:polyisoprenoid-binding protein YceI